MDIHKSDIDELKQKVAKKNYAKYLLEMNIERVRALRGQKIKFDFPVTALIGTNGGGKSTVMGAAAIAYKSVKPGDFFPKATVGDNSMADWRIDYEIIDRSESQEVIRNKNARFASAKWRRDDFLDRDVVIFPIKRTVPAGEQTRYRRFVGIYSMEDPVIELLPKEVSHRAGRILGKDLTDYKIARQNKGDEDYILLGRRLDDNYSQFHFGAGEASIIEMVSKIETSKNFSLVIIEEIENGLHPLATEKMVEYLIDVAKRKQVQVIFTTHSEYALKRLPPEAKWACVDGKLFQGDLDIDSLRAINGAVQKEQVIFVEDAFAKDWAEDILRQYCAKKMPALEVHGAGGYPFVLEVARYHNLNPAIKTKAIALIDGDAAHIGDLPEFVFRLPGGIPESTVWSFVESDIDKYVAVLQQRCQIPQVSQDEIKRRVKEVSIDAGDPHLLYKKLGERLGFISEIIVRRAFISIFDEHNAELLVDFVQAVDPALVTPEEDVLEVV